MYMRAMTVTRSASQVRYSGVQSMFQRSATRRHARSQCGRTRSNRATAPAPFKGQHHAAVDGAVGLVLT
eukprot:scaffold12265_cov116-Isochrysis_galbana.AAC.2